MPQETEIKLRATSANAARRKLRAAGFAILKKRHYERNILYDTDPPTLRPQGQLLRLREAAGENILTFKGRAAESTKHKTREEIETTIGDAHSIETILARLQLKPGFVYEKYRTEFQRPRGQGVAVLDETPIGVFLELEGPPAWIDRTAKLLGYQPGDYILKSYGALWAETGAAGDFIFPRQRDSKTRRSSK